jgi:hypothetical protein
MKENPKRIGVGVPSLMREYENGVQVVVGLVAWSLYTKKETGSGLPAGPGGILGAAEGFSYLTLLGGIIVFGLNAAGF